MGTSNERLHKDNSQMRTIILIGGSVITILIGMVSYLGNEGFSSIKEDIVSIKDTTQDMNDKQIEFQATFKEQMNQVRKDVTEFKDDLNAYQKNSNERIESIEKRLEAQIDQTRRELDDFKNAGGRFTVDDARRLEEKFNIRIERLEQGFQE